MFTTVAFRVGGASIALWVYVLLRRLPVLLSGRRVLALMGMGVLNNVIPFSLIVWGQQHIPSGLAGILNAATAVFSVLLAAMVFVDERLTLNKGIGVFVGFVGVVVVVGRDALVALDITSLGQLAMIGAAISYALSSSFAKITLHDLRPEVSAAGMLTASACVMVPLALIWDGIPVLDYSSSGWAALAYLALASSAFAYVIFYHILRIAGAGNLQLVTLLVGPVAVGLGALVFNETLHPNEYAGFAVIAVGLFIIDGRLPAWLRSVFA